MNRERNSFDLYNREQGLPSNRIYGILEDDDGNMWVSSNVGLSKFNPVSRTFKNFGIKDGLQGYKFIFSTCFKGKEGKMYFGGSKGLNVFFPRKITYNQYTPPVVFTAFRLFNRDIKLEKSITFTSEMTLSHKDSLFSFEFAALDYSDPVRNQYAYKLEGVNDNWIPLQNKHEITFSNLSPGKYILRVRGSNNDGIWNEKGTSIKIIITPPFWKTWWFKTILLILLIWILIVLYRKKIKLLKKKNRKEIEDLLYISSHTVKNHVYNIYKKLQVKNRGELILLIESLKKHE